MSTSPARVRAARVWGSVWPVLRDTLVTPVRTGRLRATGWPEGLRPVVALGLVAYGAAVLLVLLSGPIREHSTLSSQVGGDLSLPRWPLFLVLVLTLVATAMLHVASLHLPVWARLVGLGIVLLVVLRLGVSGATADSLARPLAWVTCLVLGAITALRWRGRFTWWEFPLSFGVLGVAVGVSLRDIARTAAPLGYDFTPLVATQTLQLVGSLAVPVTVVAGLAFAQLAVTFSVRVGEAVGSRRWLLPAAVAVAAVARVALTVRHVVESHGAPGGELDPLVAAFVLVAAVVAVAAALLGLRATRLPSVAGLDGVLAAVAVPAAVLLTLTVVPDLVAVSLGRVLQVYQGTETNGLIVLGDQLLSTPVVVAVRVLASLTLVAYGVVLRRRGQVAAALLSATIGVVVLSFYVRRLTAGVVELRWTADAVGDVVSSAALVLLGVFAVRRRLTTPRACALGIVIGLSLAYGVRDALDQPLTALIGISGTATVLFGLVWSLLTEGADLTRGTPRWPTPARVLLFLANGLLGVTALAFLAIGRMGPFGIDLSGFADLGDAYLGTGLLLAVDVVLVWSCFVEPEPVTEPTTDPGTEPVAAPQRFWSGRPVIRT